MLRAQKCCLELALSVCPESCGPELLARVPLPRLARRNACILARHNAATLESLISHATYDVANAKDSLVIDRLDVLGSSDALESGGGCKG